MRAARPALGLGASPLDPAPHSGRPMRISKAVGKVDGDSPDGLLVFQARQQPLKRHSKYAFL